MTTQEALEILYKGIAPNPTANNECIELCKKTLEKQIPKKPIKIDETYVVERDEWVVDYKCPSCGNPYADDSFCSCCGQALDWSDTE